MTGFLFAISINRIGINLLLKCDKGQEKQSEVGKSITNPKRLQEFEKELIKKDKVDIKQNFKIIKALYGEAVALGVIPVKDPLDGLEIDIKIAKVVNSN